MSAPQVLPTPLATNSAQADEGHSPLESQDSELPRQDLEGSGLHAPAVIHGYNVLPMFQTSSPLVTTSSDNNHDNDNDHDNNKDHQGATRLSSPSSHEPCPAIADQCQTVRLIPDNASLEANNAKKRKCASDDASDRTLSNKRHGPRHAYTPLRSWPTSSEYSYDSEEADTTPMQKLLDSIAASEEELVKDEADFESCDPDVKQALCEIKRQLQLYRDRIPKVASDIACTQRLLKEIDGDLSNMWKQIRETNNKVLARLDV